MRKKGEGSIRFYTFKDLEKLEIVLGEDVTRDFPIHLHKKYCMGVILKGNVVFRLGTDQYSLEKGSTYFINPGEVHSFEPVSSEGFSYLVFCFEGELGRYFIPADQSGREMDFRFCRPVLEDAAVADRLDRFFKFLLKSPSSLEREHELMMVLADLETNRVYENNGQTNASVDIQGVCDFIQQHLGESLSLEQLSEACILSKFHFSRLFKAQVGLSPYDYQLQVRIKKAQKLLWETTSLAELAADLGFADQSHFTRTFKKYTGITPAQYISSNFQV